MSDRPTTPAQSKLGRLLCKCRKRFGFLGGLFSFVGVVFWYVERFVGLAGMKDDLSTWQNVLTTMSVALPEWSYDLTRYVGGAGIGILLLLFWFLCDEWWRSSEFTVVRLGNKGFSIGFQNRTRLFVQEWPWIRLVKPVVAQAKPIEVKVSLGSVVLNVRKPPFYRKILYRVRGLLGLSPIPPKEQKGS